MKITSLTHEFVDSTPTELNEGTLYISMRFRTAVHLCACGCGNKVVTPIRPAKWKLIFDGDFVSFSPSIGNWQFPCRSHYWIDRSKIRWGKSWSDEEIAEGRANDAEDTRLYYSERQPQRSAEVLSNSSIDEKNGIFLRILRKMR